MSVQVKRFDSLEEFIAISRTCPCTDAEKSWFNGETVAQTCEFSLNGNESVVAEAEALIEQLSNITEGAPVNAWGNSPAGAYPIVPEFLAGRPDCMRAMQPTDDLSPVNIYVCTTSSASVDSEEYMKRGAAILALVMKLQQIRSVNLFVTFECDGGRVSDDAIQIIPVESRPLNISQAAYLLSSTGFSRHMTYGYGRTKQTSRLSWISEFNSGRPSAQYFTKVAEYYELSSSDIHIKPIHRNDPMLSDPVAWINAQLERYNGGAE